MARRDKKNRTCERCGKECANPNKLREHLNRKFKCKPKPVRPQSPEPTTEAIPASINLPEQTPALERPQSPAPVVHT